MIGKAILIWFAFALLAITNGIVRNSFITPALGDYAGHIISTVILCIVILLVTLLTVRWIGIRSLGAALGVGTLWLAMTVAFEFLAGHYLFGNSWDRLLADYNLANGRVWVFVLIVTWLAPLWAAFRRGLIRRSV